MQNGMRFLGIVFLIGLSLVFGVAALRAALPGDSTSGHFHLGDPVITGAPLLGSQEEVMELSVPALNVILTCTSSHAEGKFLALKEALATIKFTGCKVLSKEKKELPCQIINGTEKGVIAVTARFLPILHNGELFALAEPDSPLTSFTKVTTETPSECPLPASVAVTGSVTTQVPATTATQPLMTFSEAIQKLTGDKLFFGANEAFLKGSATVKLTGEYEGYAFSVIG